MDKESDGTKLDSLKQRLYSKTMGKPIMDSTRGATLERPTDNEDVNQWGDTPLPEHVEEIPHHSKATHFFKMLFFLSALFCFAAAAIAAFIFYTNFNLVSPNNVDITALGPVSVAGGDTLSLLVGVANNNRASLVNATIKVDYPDGAYNATDTTRTLVEDDRSIGTINANSQAQVTFNSVLFGQENSSKTIQVTIQYSLPGSDTVYTKEKDYDILLTKAPLSLLVNYDNTVTAGQGTTFTITAISNSQSNLSNITLKAMYPTGWTFATSDPETMQTTNDTWQLGDFTPGQQKVITVHGTLDGQEGDQRVFRFSLGTPTAGDARTLATDYVDSLATVSLTQPSVLADLAFGTENADGDVVASLGDTLSGSLNIQNNTSSDLVGVVVQVTPEDQNLYNRYSVNTSDGYYKSAQNIIYWDKTLKPGLATLSAGGKISVNFGLTTNALSQLAQVVRNPELTLDIVITGTSISQNGGTKTVSVEYLKNVKFSTAPSVGEDTLHSTGPYTNTGPVPPHAEQTTTYTLDFKVANTVNQLSGAKLTATLPFYVTYAQASSSIAGNEDVTYDPNSRIVTWNIGDVAAFVGYNGNQFREGAFQVSIMPSTTQIGQVPPLATGISFTGVDSFTGNVVKMNLSNLTTKSASENVSGAVGQ